MKLKRRTTAPEASNKYYINYKYGGYNTAVVVNNKTGSVLPNCVGYAQGRLMEAMETKKVDWKLPACYAEDFIDKAKENGLSFGTIPKLGAIIVWSAGQKHNPKDGAGHVMFIEHIDSNGDLDCTGYDWGVDKFYTRHVTKASGYMYRSDRKFEGFLYAPVEFEEETPAPSSTPTGTIYRVQVGAFSVKENAIKRAKELKSKGFDAIIKYVDGNYKPQVGAYEVRHNAEVMLDKVKSTGYNAFITTQGGPEIPF